MSIAEWWGGATKQLQDAEDRATRSVALISASIHVASRNIGATLRGQGILTHDDVIKAAKDYESYIRGAK